MKRLSILYLGPDSFTSRHRALALGRLGHCVKIVDTAECIPNTRFCRSWAFHTGSLFLEKLVHRNIATRIPSDHFDLVFVDAGELVGPSLVCDLKSRFGTVLNYNVDDPFGCRDGRKWRLYRRAVPFYDLITVVRQCNVAEAELAGARNVRWVYRSADEVAHAPKPFSDSDSLKWSSEVAFIGTWMPERGPFLAKLVDLGIPLTIYGNRWQRAKEWNVLRSSWRGPGLDNDDDYAKAIQYSKVCIGMLSKGNRDLSTQRSFEIPSLGGVLCAERTIEHSQLYKEDEEAVFWSTPEECAAKCLELLRNPDRRTLIANNGRSRCLSNGTLNEAILKEILESLHIRNAEHRCHVSDSLTLEVLNHA